jgi:hypothetical protein
MWFVFARSGFMRRGNPAFWVFYLCFMEINGRYNVIFKAIFNSLTVSGGKMPPLQLQTVFFILRSRTSVRFL